jgi:3-phenylpropionate/trans-cinnamate dioxygenase ferredoxin reductase component
VSEPVVVVGNGVAGAACALGLGQRDVACVLIGPGVIHDRPPLSKRALATGRVPLIADDAKLAAHHVTHIDGVVTGIDPGRRRVTVTGTSDADPIELAYAQLVWATGLRYPPPPVPGMDRAEQNTTAAGMLRLVARLRSPRRVAIVGAGLIGTETAATLARLGHDVALLDILEHPLHRFVAAVRNAGAAMLDQLGVRFIGACAIDRVRAGVVVTRTHGDVAADVVINACGFRSSLPDQLANPTYPLAMDADETLWVAHHDLWACGDCVRFPHPRFGRIGIQHWDHAVASGRHVAACIAGDSAAYVRDPYFFSDIGPLRIQQVGLADAACDWAERGGLITGRDDTGRTCCVVLLNAPARLNEARALLAA